jgi:hypothetical protein
MENELYMCRTDFEYELGCAAGGNKVYANIDDLKSSRPCVSSCGIVAVKVELVRIVEPGTGMEDD